MTDPASSAPAPDVEDVQTFLACLYPDTLGEGLVIAPGRALALWDPRPRTTWIHDPTKAAATLAGLSRDRDTYFHVCLHSWDIVKAAKAKLGVTADFRNSRGEAGSAVVAPGCWVDIDHESTGHEAKDLAPDLASVLHVVGEFPLAPSLVIDTGGGVHAYWLFNDPIALDDPITGEDLKQRVYSANMRLQVMLRESMRACGWGGVDHTHDLARILRVPGTVNWKYRTLVKFQEKTAARYSLEDIELVLPSMDCPLFSSSARPVATDGYRAAFDLNVDGAVPSRLSHAIVHGVVDELFIATWDRKRKIKGRGVHPGQRPLANDTASEYTLALVSRMLNLADDWTDQELADAIMAWRVRHGELIKGGRPMSDADLRRRIELTIALARSGRTTMEVADDLDENPDVAHAVQELHRRAQLAHEAVRATEPVAEGDRAKLIAKVSTAIGAPLIAVERVMHEEGGARYTIVLDGGARVCVGGAAQLMDPRRMRAVMLDIGGVMLRRYKGPEWDPIASALRDVAVDLDGTEIPTEGEEYAELLRVYLRAVEVLDQSASDGETGAWSRPSDGRIAFRPSHFENWLSVARPGGRCGARQWVLRLRSAKLGKSSSVRVGGRVVRAFLTNWTRADIETPNTEVDSG